MECIEGNYKIKLILEGQAASVRDLKSKIGSRRRTEVALREADHVPRWIDAHDRSWRHAYGDFRGDLSVAATDMEDARGAVEVKKREYFLSHRFLERRTS